MLAADGVKCNTVPNNNTKPLVPLSTRMNMICLQTYLYLIEDSTRKLLLRIMAGKKRIIFFKQVGLETNAFFCILPVTHNNYVISDTLSEQILPSFAGKGASISDLIERPANTISRRD